MIELYADVLVNNTLLELLSERGRNRVVKNALIHGLRYWHTKILPTHFEAGNLLAYPNSFKAKKRGISLVDTGDFRDRILSNPTIRATAKHASIRYPFGRPNDVSSKNSLFYQEYEKKNPREMGSKTRNHIFSFMRGKKITFEQARLQLIGKRYKSTGYNAKTKKLMTRGVSAMNDKDRQVIYKVMENFVVDNWKTLGKANIKVNK